MKCIIEHHTLQIIERRSRVIEIDAVLLEVENCLAIIPDETAAAEFNVRNHGTPYAPGTMDVRNVAV